MNPIEHSDFSLALFCPNERQLKVNLREILETSPTLNSANKSDDLIIDFLRKLSHYQLTVFWWSLHFQKNLDSDIKDMRLMDLLDRSNLVEFPFSYHCR